MAQNIHSKGSKSLDSYCIPVPHRKCGTNFLIWINYDIVALVFEFEYFGYGFDAEKMKIFFVRETM